MKADLHPREAERLNLLRSYDILDTPRGQDFDDVVALASQICQAPISTVTLIDADRQWYHAEVGLGVRQNPLDTAFCSHAILQEDFVEIPDMQDDSRFADNPYVTGAPGARFYAGAVLRSDDGLPLGTLCVIDFRPRALTPLQRETLRVLSRQVMAQLDLRRALRQADVLRREVDHRVKNSLQSLSALARLQAKNAADPAVAAALEQMQHRIHSVAMLHDQLYRTDAGGTINLAAYMANLADYMSSVAGPNVSITSRAAAVGVTSGQASLIGTIINEFTANSIKYAFPDGRPGKVTLDLRHDVAGQAQLTLTDNGVGLPPGAVLSTKGLGMTVLRAVGQQLGGEVALSACDPGTRLDLTFAPDPA